MKISKKTYIENSLKQGLKNLQVYTYTFLKRYSLISITVCVWAAFLVSCGGTHHLIPTETRVENVTNYIDSVRWHIKDSVVLIPRSVIKDYGLIGDTLHMESNQAEAQCWVDTSLGMLNGRLEDKEVLETESHIEYRVQYIERTDTLVCYKEVGVPYEVVKFKTPKWCWYSLLFSILCVAAMIFVWKS